MTAERTGPLAGVRILEFSQIVAGPFAGLALSDLGAEVVKVEPLEGESRRNSGAVVPNEGKYFQSLNRGKRSLTVNLADPAGRELIHRIIPHFDVVISNYRLGVTKRLGIDYDALKVRHPSLIYANLTGFGDRGPYATRAGSDVVAQAYSGLMAAEGKTDEHGAPSQIISTTVIDRTTGAAAAMGICAALYHRSRTGEGQEIHASLLNTALEMLSHAVMREPVHDATMRDPFVAQLSELRDSGAPYNELVALRLGQAPRFAGHRLYYGGYHTAAGAVVLGALTKQNRQAIRRVLDMHDTTDTPEYDNTDPSNPDRLNRWRAEIQRKLLEKTAPEWVEIFLEAGVPASVVQMPEEMADDPQVEALGIMVDLEHAVTGPQRVVGPLLRMSATPTSVASAAPQLAADTSDILGECGLSKAEVEALLAKGVVTQA